MSAPELPKGWHFYGCGENPSYVTSEESGPRAVWMLRKGQRCRFIDAEGIQVGPLHGNVAPAVCWAASEGWMDPRNLSLSLALTAEVRGQMRARDTTK